MTTQVSRGFNEGDEIIGLRQAFDTVLPGKALVRDFLYAVDGTRNESLAHYRDCYDGHAPFPY